jgi:hypothetical protein
MKEAARSGKRDSFHWENGFGQRVHIFQQKVLENQFQLWQIARPL